jgi:solute carrier family 44 protein 1 (choline transporter-like protein)/choline transporter-like protein 2/4/5
MCTIHVYETFLRYVSLHSVVQVAVWSEPYYECSKKAYFLLFRNQHKVKDLDTLQSFVVFQLQVCVSLLGAIPCYVGIQYFEVTLIGNLTSQIEMPVVPTLFMFIIGAFYTSIF